MSIKQLKFTINGEKPLLMNNPQTVDRFNHFAKEMSRINAKGQGRTDEDFLALRDLEMSAKIYFDDDLGIYVPTRWVAAALAKSSFTLTKISKEKVRGSVFLEGEKMKLTYRGMKNVKHPDDIIMDHKFRHVMLLPQGRVRVAKVTPIFHDWSFSGSMEYDDRVIDQSKLKTILEHTAKYGGYGDFRPTFGMARAIVS